MTNSITLIQEVQEVAGELKLVTAPDGFSGKLEYKAGDYLQSDIKVIKTAKGVRNAKMRACVQVYCKNAAIILNANNIEQVVSMMSLGGVTREIRRPWCEPSFKLSVFQETLLGVTEGRTRHTSKASNEELCKTDVLIASLLSEAYGIELTWPSSAPPIWNTYE